MTRLLTAIVCAIIFCSCEQITGSGNIITQTRHLNQFHEVKASGSIDIEVRNDADQSVKVEGDDNILPHVITDVRNGMLDVRLEHNISYRNITVKVYVSGPTFTRLVVSGSGSINSAGTLTAPQQIEMHVSGSGDMKASVDAPAVKADVSGSGTMTVLGKTRDLDCNVSGSGDLRCRDLLSENTNVSVSGSGTARVFSSVNLVAKVSGSGDILYTGNPTSPQIHKSGSGSVREER
jgi:hypothetical protein